MGLRKILTVKEPSLHKMCRPVEQFDGKLHKLLDDMKETLLDAGGVGLAAPQVGILRRVVVVDTGEEILELVNPELLETSGEQVGAEGCLSVPDYEGEVERASYVECEFTDRNGQRMLLQAHDLLAICIQHELDHLDGVLFIDKAQTLSPKAKEKPTDVVK